LGAVAPDILVHSTKYEGGKTMSNLIHTPNEIYNEYDFNRERFSWINNELIDKLLESLKSPIKGKKLSYQEFIDTIKYRKIKYEKRTIPYQRLRDIADFLGLPPWYFFKAMNTIQINEKYDTTNRKIEEMYANAVPNLPEIEMSSTWGIINSLMNRNLDRADIIFLERLLSRVNKDEISEDWLFVIKELEKMNKKNEFKGAATINIGNARGLNNPSTFRYCRGHGKIHNNTYNIEWSSAWFAVDIVENDSVSMDHINYIVNDVTRIIGNIPWKFIMSINQKTRYLYSWHSLRNMDIEILDVCKTKVDEVLERMLPTAINRLYCMQLIRNRRPSQELLSKKNPLLSWLALDVKYKNTLEFLIEINYIKEYDRLVFKKNNIIFDTSNVLNDNESFFYGSIVLHQKPYIKWEYDGQIYSISKLTQIIYHQLTGQNNYLNGNKHWCKSGEIKSLYHTREIIVGKR
jgi:hypothetical protein